ncbi:uncharacterized protein LOC126373932 [Pectinophora gossypiella]|uniref:uncharacterized protein LOC126373932 n=1 Tax=Pectinophora gossypiella TaxID=13191 RepID=UPI00214EF45D|nr:uncharacterized protein LOC126373932 [Pectinophora gossypiella]
MKVKKSAEPRMLQTVYVREPCSEEEAGAGAGAGAAAVGRLVDSSQADDRRMIRLVRERRLLYARNNMPVASYYAQVKSLWEEVAIEMGWTVGDVRRKWSHIRNSYSRHLRNELGGARTGRGRAVSRWYLADELDFLREHMATDTRGAATGYAPSMLEMGEQAHAAEQDVKPLLGFSWLTPMPRISDVHSEVADDSSSSQAFASDENSSFFQFFRGIYDDYQELSSRRRRQFKRRCLDALHALLDEQDAAGGDASPTGEETHALTPHLAGPPQSPHATPLSADSILPND